VTVASGPASRGRLIAFDLDGTLVDSRQDLADSANQLVVELGGRPLASDAVVDMVGEGASVLVRKALAAAAVPDRPAALGRFLEIYDERLLRSTRLYPGIQEVLEEARRRARVVVLTNKPRRHTERLLDGLGLRALFDDLVGGDGPHARKPSPDGLRALMTAAGAAAPATLMVGDSMVDLETARNAGVRCCVVSWGFGYSRIPPGTLAPGDAVVQTVTELRTYVERLFPFTSGP
jgi:phosphoglycolate phosphatase